MTSKRSETLTKYNIPNTNISIFTATCKSKALTIYIVNEIMNYAKSPYVLHSADKWYGAQQRAVIHCLWPVIGGPTRLPVSTFQDIIIPFLQPETKYLLFGDHAIHNTQLVWPVDSNVQNIYIYMSINVDKYENHN